MEDLIIDQTLTKEEKYIQLAAQLEALIGDEQDTIANMANMAAALKEAFQWWWVGFYIVRNHHNEEVLVLGPFQGPIACTRIAHGRGVCGTSWKEQKTLMVPDVDQFPGHIACSSASRSEIVIPCFSGDKIAAVLDADSEFLNHFDETDRHWLEQFVKLLKL